TQGAGESVRGLDGGNDALGAAEEPQCLHGLAVGSREVRRTTDVGEPGVFRPDSRVVESGRDRVRLDRLTVVILKEVGARTVQDARTAAFDRRRVALRLDSVAGCLEAIEAHFGI